MVDITTASWRLAKMGVSLYHPISSISIGFSIINHPFWGIPICGNPQLGLYGLIIEATTMTRGNNLAQLSETFVGFQTP